MGASPRRVLSAIVVIATMTLLVPSARAQSASVRIEQEPYYAGVPFGLELQLRGFAPEPEPECTAPEREGLSLVSYGVRPTQTFMRDVNGQRTVEYQLGVRFEATATKPGKYRIGPFTIRQDQKTARTGVITVEVIPVATTDEMRFKVVLPEKPIYVGQRAPVAVEWWVKEEVSSAYLENVSSNFSVPLFLEPSGFRWIDEEPQPGESALPFATHAGPQRLRLDVTKRTVDGQTWVVVRAPRTLVPTRVGEYEFEAATVTADKVVGRSRRSRGLFSRPVLDTRKYQVSDLPRTLSVLDLPRAGRPKSFAGAVGTGYSVEVSADRTVVQTTDPITLTVTVRGQGIDTAGLPDLADAGLSRRQFRTQSRGAGGILAEDGSKTFTVMVRAIDENLDSIPAIEYSWFDTETGKYQTTQSRPIALSVRKGQLVTAADAVGSARDEATDDSESPTAANDDRGSGSSQPTFTLTGADLSLSDPQIALQDQDGRLGGPAVRWALYGLPFLLLALAWFGRVRASIDPEIAARRKRLNEARRSIESARSLEPRQAAERIAGALRVMISDVPQARTPDLEALLAELEVLIYAPDGSSATLDASVHDRASMFADAIREHAS